MCTLDHLLTSMLILYSDNSCGNEMFTFTRPHANLFRQTKGDDVGRQVKSIKCMIARSPLDRKGHIFTSDRPSTKSAAAAHMILALVTRLVELHTPTTT